MNAETLIDEIQKLPLDEVQKVDAFLSGYVSDLEANIISEKRDEELESGAVQPLTHAEVFGHEISVE